MGKTATAPGGLVFEAADVVRCGRVADRCGPVVYRLLRHLADSPARASTTADVAVAVWGEEMGPGISRVTLKSAIHRANEVLARVGSREAVTLDGEAVLLL